MSKNIKEKLIIFLLLSISLSFFIFSYFWIDYGLFLLVADGHPFLNHFAEIIPFRDGHRPLLANVYLFLLLILFAFQIFFLFTKRFKFIKVRNLFFTALVTTFLFSLSYPFLSRDLFSYLFSAKMVWFYHVNPFVVAPLNYLSTDLWVGLAHNIEFPYAYGPTSLAYSLIPMIFFSGKRFILNFLGYKLMNAALFYLAGFLLYKINDKDKKVFAFWFFNPFLVMELLINSHNDLLMVALFIISVYFLFKGGKIKAWLAFIASVLTKYFSVIALPVMFLGKKYQSLYFKFLSLFSIIFLSVQKIRYVLGWYYTWLYMFLPLAKLQIKSWILISLMGLLVLIDYYPFVKWGFWGATPLISHSKWLFFSFLALIMIIEFDFPNLKKKLKFLGK